MSRARVDDTEAGITLIELVVAVLILALGTVAALRTVDQARLQVGGAEARVLAQTVALNRAAEIQLFGADEIADLPDTVVQGPVTWRVAERLEETSSGLIAVAIEVTAQGQPGARLTVWLPTGTAP